MENALSNITKLGRDDPWEGEIRFVQMKLKGASRESERRKLCKSIYRKKEFSQRTSNINTSVFTVQYHGDYITRMDFSEQSCIESKPEIGDVMRIPF